MVWLVRLCVVCVELVLVLFRWLLQLVLYASEYSLFFIKGTSTTEIYTILFVGSVGCV